MNSLQTSASDEATDAQDMDSENQATAGKSYTQEEVDNMMARMKGSLQKKLLKPYEGLGDPEELRNLRAMAEKQQTEQALKRGEFEKILQEKISAKDVEIQKRDSIIKEYKVNTPLMDAAARHRAVAPEQVRSLLANSVRLNEDGEVEVIDAKGSVRYTDKGTPVGVDDLVREFLDSNPHFVQSTPATTNSRSSHQSVATPQGVDLANLDLTRPDHREIYRQAKLKGLV